ncbi:MAG: hypothetical protein Q7U75_15960, partial [Desulfobacterales bacterium]|nr:hypothetical protein [Desulfobacterales bacterium]
MVALGSKGRCSSASVVAEGRRGRWPARDRNPDKAKLRHLQDTLYRKAKAEPGYRFWSLYGELSRRDLLE